MKWLNQRVFGLLCLLVAGGVFAQAPVSSRSDYKTGDTFDAKSLTGTWTVNLTTRLTTCEGTYEGEQSSAVWTLSFADNTLTARSSSESVFSGFAPRWDGSAFVWRLTRQLELKDGSVIDDKGTVYDLRMTKLGKLFSGRVIQSRGKELERCVVMQDVKISKE